MKTIPAELVNCGTLVFGIAIRRRDGTLLGWTGHDVDAVVSVDTDSTVIIDDFVNDSDGGIALTANPGFTVQSLVSSAGLGVDTTDIYVISADDEMTRADILARKWDGAKVFFFRYNFKLPAAGLIAVKRGSFGNFRPELGQFKVEFRDIRQALQQNTTWIFQEGCRWRLGDARCGIDLSGSDAWTVSGEVESVTSQYVFTDSGLTQASDFFGEGSVRWLTGLNADDIYKVKAFEAGVVTLTEAVVYPIQPTDTFEIIAGCRKRWEEDCKTKFDNLLNFGGEKDKPTRDELIAAASGDAP